MHPSKVFARTSDCNGEKENLEFQISFSKHNYKGGSSNAATSLPVTAWNTAS
jgi:hypothetical protein